MRRQSAVRAALGQPALDNARPVMKDTRSNDRWRTGGTVEEVMDEAHLSPRHILAGIERFVRERESRIKAMRDAVDSVARRE